MQPYKIVRILQANDQTEATMEQKINIILFYPVANTYQDGSIPFFREMAPSYRVKMLSHTEAIRYYTGVMPFHREVIPSHTLTVPWQCEVIPSYPVKVRSHTEEIPFYMVKVFLHSDKTPSQPEVMLRQAAKVSPQPVISLYKCEKHRFNNSPYKVPTYVHLITSLDLNSNEVLTFKNVEYEMQS